MYDFVFSSLCIWTRRLRNSAHFLFSCDTELVSGLLFLWVALTRSLGLLPAGQNQDKNNSAHDTSEFRGRQSHAVFTPASADLFFLKAAFFLEGLFFFLSLLILIRFYKFVFIPTALFTVHISLSFNLQYRKCFSSSDFIHSSFYLSSTCFSFSPSVLTFWSFKCRPDVFIHS